MKILTSWHSIPLSPRLFTSTFISISQVGDWVLLRKGRENNQTKLTFFSIPFGKREKIQL